MLAASLLALPNHCCAAASYAEAKQRMAEDTSSEFTATARQVLESLQLGQHHEAAQDGRPVPDWFAVWQGVCDVSLAAHHEVWARLGVDVVDRPESTYISDAQPLVEVRVMRALAALPACSEAHLVGVCVRVCVRVWAQELMDQGVAIPSQGAVVFYPEGEPCDTEDDDVAALPAMLLRKSDGSALYVAACSPAMFAPDVCRMLPAW